MAATNSARAALLLVSLAASSSASSSVIAGVFAEDPAFTELRTTAFFTFGNQSFDGCIADVAVAKPDEWCGAGCPGPSDEDVASGVYRGKVLVWNQDAKVACFTCDYAVWSVWVARVSGVGFVESLTGDPGYTPYVSCLTNFRSGGSASVCGGIRICLWH